MNTLTQNASVSGEKEQETLKNSQTEGKMTENATKLDENGVKTTDSKPMEQQYQELKKKNPGLIKRTRATAKGDVKDKPKKTEKVKTETEVTGMKDFRKPGERILVDLCKELKLSPPTRVKAKSESHSGVGALKYKLSNGNTLISVRSNDIMINLPHSYMKVGKPEIAPYDKTVTKVEMLSEAELRKAFITAFKCKKTPAEYKREANFSLAKTPVAKKAVVVKETAEEKVKRLNKELAEAKAAMRQKKQSKKPKTVAEKAVDKVAGAITPVTEPTPA